MPAARRLRALILAPVQAPAAAAQAPDPNVVEPSPEESALAAELVARGWVHMKSQLGAHRRALHPGHPTPLCIKRKVTATRCLGVGFQLLKTSRKA